MSVADAIDDVLVWAERAIKLIPAIRSLWQAVQAKNANQELAAQLELTRQMRSMQAREEIQGP